MNNFAYTFSFFFYYSGLISGIWFVLCPSFSGRHMRLGVYFRLVGNHYINERIMEITVSYTLWPGT
jgi:hypothetical protein